MNWNIVLSYPAWFVPVCLILGVIIALVVYGGRQKSVLSLPLRYLLGVFRGLVVSILAFLLLGPMIKRQVKEKEQPIVVIAQDNSQSVKFCTDTLKLRNEYIPELNHQIKLLGENYQTEAFLFGDHVSDYSKPTFGEKETDFSSLYNEMVARYTNRNVAALVIASDGNNNRGRNPQFLFNQLNFPVYTIALGDTVVKKDIGIAKVITNKISVKGNKFPIEVDISGKRANKMEYELALMENGKELQSVQGVINSDNDYQKHKFLLKAKKPGAHHYTIVLKSEGDRNKFNNKADAWIDVIDQKQKVLLLYGAPHPDIAAIKQAVNNGTNMDIDVVNIADFKASTKAYGLVIFYQLPDTKYNVGNLIAKSKESKTNLLFVLGTNSNPSAFNNLETGIRIVGNIPQFDDASPVVRSDFGYFTFPEDMEQKIESFSPLYVPLWNLSLPSEAGVWLTQRISGLSTNRPLVAFIPQLDRRIGIIAGESIWRWRMSDYQANGNKKTFTTLMTKIVQYLSVQSDRRQLQINVPNEIYDNQELQVRGELYNESFEKVNSFPVQWILYDKEGREYPFDMDALEHDYHLDAGVFPSGEYHWLAKAQIGKKKLSVSGKILIKELQKEQFIQQANFSNLQQLSSGSDGEVLMMNDVSKLSKTIYDREGSKSIVHYNDFYQMFIEMFWLWLLLIVLLAAEWGVRRYKGTV
ncbi:MAG: hypothetical protein ACEPOW_12605 [Bacteroidales bacterium]